MGGWKFYNPCQQSLFISTLHLMSEEYGQTHKDDHWLRRPVLDGQSKMSGGTGDKRNKIASARDSTTAVIMWSVPEANLWGGWMFCSCWDGVVDVSEVYSTLLTCQKCCSDRHCRYLCLKQDQSNKIHGDIQPDHRWYFHLSLVKSKYRNSQY